MVLDTHGEPLLARVEGRAFRHRPAQQDAVQLQPEVVVETRRRVLLDAVRPSACGAPLTGRLRRPREVPLLLIVLEPHFRNSLREGGIGGTCLAGSLVKPKTQSIGLREGSF